MKSAAYDLATPASCAVAGLGALLAQVTDSPRVTTGAIILAAIMTINVAAKYGAVAIEAIDRLTARILEARKDRERIADLEAQVRALESAKSDTPTP